MATGNFYGKSPLLNANELFTTCYNMIISQRVYSDNIKGTYEEIYSNWKNKMHHAVDINSNYLSFRTMASCQEFYDEMALLFDIPRIELLEKYSSVDLASNEMAFIESMEEWKKLYTLVGLEVEQYNSLEELNNLYGKKGLKY